MLKHFAAVTLLACLPVVALAQEKEKDATDMDPVITKFEGDANDADALRKYAGEIFGDVAGLLQAEKLDEAQAKIDALEELSDGLDLTDAAAKQTQDRIASAVTFFRGRLELARISIADLEKTLKEKPDAKTVEQYIGKLGQQLSGLARSEPAKAGEQLSAAKALLEEVAEGSEDDEVKQAVRLGARMFRQLEQVIDRETKLAELIGNDAAPLEIKEWVNGEGLSDEDLKGKVVMLDFWAVWCGPCIATFPQLREWNEKYADKGLVIIGLTRYYNMKWDEEDGRATRSTDEVTPAEEQAMLVKFAEEHKLGHRFGVQDDSLLSDYYAVTGIPHVVLIDREGKVRLIKVGSGPDNAKAIGAMIEELIAG